MRFEDKNSLKYKKSAFTLAEVLITLGIIGVVATMTIPTLISNTRSQQYRSKLKKTVSTLSQAAKMSQAQYGFDYAGMTKTCSANGQSDHPETNMSICAILNGTLTGATYFNNASDIKLKKAGRDEYYTLQSKFLRSVGNDNSKDYHAYVLSDGVIVGFWKGIGFVPCELPIGTPMKDIFPAVSEKVMALCFGFIDVNGANLPNMEVSCSSGTNSLSKTDCVVKNDAKHMTDVYPIRFHDGIVEPVTAAGRYVLHTAK